MLYDYSANLSAISVSLEFLSNFLSKEHDCSGPFGVSPLNRAVQHFPKVMKTWIGQFLDMLHPGNHEWKSIYVGTNYPYQSGYDQDPVFYRDVQKKA